MTTESAKELFPIWAASEWKEIMEDESQVRIYRPEKKRRSPAPEPPLRMKLYEMVDRLWKKHCVLILTALGLTLWTMITCGLTTAVVRKTTTEEVTAQVTSELRAGFAEYLAQMDAEQSREQFLTGDASFEAAVEEIAVPMSQVIGTYRMEYGINPDGLRTIGWVFCARVAKNSTEFGKTPQEILAKDGAWEGKPVGHATSSQDLELAREIARDFLQGIYPDIYTTAQTFCTREAGGKIIARNELFTGPYTEYWWYGK